MEIRTDRHITARRPDIVVVEKRSRKATIIDVAVPLDCNVKMKQLVKIEKYQDLRLEIQRLWNVQATVVPVVVGALGSHTPDLQRHLDELPGNHKVASIVKSALLGSAHVLRKTLNLPESW